MSVGSVSSMSSSSSSLTICGQRQENQKLRGVGVVEIKSTATLSMSANHTVVSDQSSRSEEKQTQDAMSTGSSPLLVVTFPVKLRMMLDHVHDNGLEDVVSWELDGKAFKVHKIDDFEKQIMPSFFNQTKFKSFQRQLNFYGFVRITSGKTKGCYLHKLFVRDDPSLCKDIARRRAGSAGATPFPAASMSSPRGINVIPPRTPSVVSELDASTSSKHSMHQHRENDAVPASILLASGSNTGPRGNVDALDGKCYDMSPGCVSVNSFPIPTPIGKVSSNDPEDAFERLLDKVLGEDKDCHGVLGGCFRQGNMQVGNSVECLLSPAPINVTSLSEQQGLHQPLDFSCVGHAANETLFQQY